MPSPRSPDKRKAAPQMEKEGSGAAGNRGQAEPAMGRLRAPPCRHLTQHRHSSRLPNSIAELHISRIADEETGHLLRTPYPPYDPNFVELRHGEVRRINLPRTL